jgi:hypothetical protein
MFVNENCTIYLRFSNELYWTQILACIPSHFRLEISVIGNNLCPKCFIHGIELAKPVRISSRKQAVPRLSMLLTVYQ